MVYAVQIKIHGGWRITSVCDVEGRAESARPGVSKTYGCDTRVQPFDTVDDAWAGRSPIATPCPYADRSDAHDLDEANPFQQ